MSSIWEICWPAELSALTTSYEEIWPDVTASRAPTLKSATMEARQELPAKELLSATWLTSGTRNADVLVSEPQAVSIRTTASRPQTAALFRTERTPLSGAVPQDRTVRIPVAGRFPRRLFRRADPPAPAEGFGCTGRREHVPRPGGQSSARPGSRALGVPVRYVHSQVSYPCG